MTRQMMKVLEVAAPGKALNMNERLHHMERARRNEVWRDAAFWWAKQHRLRCTKAIGRVEVWFEFGTDRPNHRRDPHNWAPTIKPILDGFTLACVWDDDDSKHVKTYEPVFTSDVPKGRIKILLSWEEE